MQSAAYDAVYDVMISYRRSDGELAAYVEDMARAMGLRVFRDLNEHAPGYDWRSFWRSALARAPDPLYDPSVGPLVLVLATRAIGEIREQDEVVRELEEALLAPLKAPIALVEFDPPSLSRLLQRLAARDPGGARLLGDAHRIELPAFPVEKPHASSSQDRAAFHNGIRRAAMASLRRRLDAAGDRAREWASALLSNFLSPECDLGSSIGAGASDWSAQSRAYIGAGGLGKSVRMARAVLSLARDEGRADATPVLIAADQLHEGLAVFSQALGFLAGDAALLDEHVSWCEHQLQRSIVFVIDGLERSPQPARAAAVLADAAQAARLWLTARPEIWSDVYAPVLKWGDQAIVHMKPLDVAGAANELGVSAAVIASRPFLAQPVFLDIALRMAAEREISLAPESLAALSETSLLAGLRQWAVKDPPGDAYQPFSAACSDFLTTLAAKQLERADFVVPADDVSDWGLGSARDDVIERLLRQRRYLLEQRVNGRPGYRLRHDVIDGAALASSVDAKGMERILSRIETGFGQIVAAQCVQRASDLGELGPIDLVFDRFLLLVDNKDYVGAEGSWNPGGWGAGFVVQQKLNVFKDHIAAVLEARQPQAADQAGVAVSRRAKPARITLGALSSVASMLRGAGEDGLIDEDGSLARSLLRHIANPRVLRRARLIEGLGRLRDRKGSADGSVRALSRLGRRLDRDAGAAGYVAEALSACRSPRSLAELDQLAARLQRKSGRSGGDPAHQISVRGVIERRNALAQRMGVVEVAPPPLEVGEVRRALSLHGPKLNDVSDWLIWRAYAQRLTQTEEGRKLLIAQPDVILSLARGRWHDHTQTRRDAMIALGACDLDTAFHLLLDAAVWERINVVEDAVFSGLRRHGERLRAENRGETAAIVLAQAAARRRTWDRNGDAAFESAIAKTGCKPGCVITAGAVELGCFTEAALHRSPHSKLQAPFAALIADAGDPGPQWENKYRLGPAAITDGRLACALSEARWGEAAALHTALLQWRDPPTLRARVGFAGDIDAARLHDDAIEKYLQTALLRSQCFRAALEGKACAPAITSVHAIVVTRDGETLFSKRAADSHYYPGAWSASFEEQVTESDLSAAHPFYAAALRGLREEFGESAPARPLAQSLFFELDTLGLGVLVVLEMDKPALSELCAGSGAGGEIARRALAPLSMCVATSAAETWHPTSTARIELARRVLHMTQEPAGRESE